MGSRTLSADLACFLWSPTLCTDVAPLCTALMKWYPWLHYTVGFIDRYEEVRVRHLISHEHSEWALTPCSHLGLIHQSLLWLSHPWASTLVPAPEICENTEVWRDLMITRDTSTSHGPLISHLCSSVYSSCAVAHLRTGSPLATFALRECSYESCETCNCCIAEDTPWQNVSLAMNLDYLGKKEELSASLSLTCLTNVLFCTPSMHWACCVWETTLVHLEAPFLPLNHLFYSVRCCCTAQSGR